MTEDQFERLAQMIKGVHDEVVDNFEQVETRFDVIDQRFEQVNKRFDHVEVRFDKIETELVYIRSELRDIRHDLEVLKEKVTGHEGYTKEIDHAPARIVAIEKHIGMQSVV